MITIPAGVIVGFSFVGLCAKCYQKNTQIVYSEKNILSRKKRENDQENENYLDLSGRPACVLLTNDKSAEIHLVPKLDDDLVENILPRFSISRYIFDLAYALPKTNQFWLSSLVVKVESHSPGSSVLELSHSIIGDGKDGKISVCHKQNNTDNTILIDPINITYIEHRVIVKTDDPNGIWAVGSVINTTPIDHIISRSEIYLTGYCAIDALCHIFTGQHQLFFLDAFLLHFLCEYNRILFNKLRRV